MRRAKYSRLTFLNMNLRQNIYFLSDAHLGSPSHKDSIETERKLTHFFDEIKEYAKAIYMVGDMFDYWFEYKNVVPRGFTRFLGKLSELTDSGIEIHFFIGNHDIWLTDYLEKECGLIIHREPLTAQLYDKTFFIAHGDGLGEESWKARMLRKVFHSKFLRFLFAGIHPRWTIGFAHKWSAHSRQTGDISDFLGEEREFLIQFAKEKIKETPDIDYFIFGHRHILLDFPLTEKTHVIHLGDWINHFSYAVFDSSHLRLKTFTTQSACQTI